MDGRCRRQIRQWREMRGQLSVVGLRSQRLRSQSLSQVTADLTRALREEAKSILATYERRHKEVQDQAERIVSSAREEALAAAKQAKDELKRSIARRLAAATDQIASAEAAAIRQVREQAVTVAVAAAGDVLARQMTADAASSSIDAAIAQVEARMH